MKNGLGKSIRCLHAIIAVPTFNCFPVKLKVDAGPRRCKSDCEMKTITVHVTDKAHAEIKRLAKLDLRSMRVWLQLYLDFQFGVATPDAIRPVAPPFQREVAPIWRDPVTVPEQPYIGDVFPDPNRVTCAAPSGIVAGIETQVQG